MPFCWLCLVVVSVVSMGVCVFLFFFSFVLHQQQPQEQSCPFLSVCVVYSCVQTVVWLPVSGIFNVCTDIEACDCTWGLYRHPERVYTGS